MTTSESKSTEEILIRKLMDDQVKALRTKDIDGAVSGYASDVISFDLLPPMSYNGADAIRKRLEEWLSSFRGPIGYEISNVSITAGDDVAFSHSLNGVKGTKTDGAEIEMGWRKTVCYRKIDGNWMITHEHGSVPFDIESGKALLTLKP